MDVVNDSLFMNKSALYSALTLTIQHFECGLHNFANKDIPSGADYIRLAALASKAVPSLASKQRVFECFNDELFSFSVNATKKSTNAWRNYLAREKYYLTSCLWLIDHCVVKAVQLLNNLAKQNQWEKVKPLVTWSNALHPQIGAVIALEASRHLSLIHPSDAEAIITQTLADDSDTLSGEIKRLLHLGTNSPPRLDILAPTKHRALSLAPLTDGKLFVGGFSPDMTSGGISLYDPDKNIFTVFKDNIICTGLWFDSEKNHVLASALRSIDCEGPHLAVIDLSSRVKRIIELAPFIGSNAIPGFVKKNDNRVYIRNGLNKTLLEMDDEFKNTTIHYNEELKKSCNYSLIDNNIAISNFHENYYTLYDINSKKIISKKYFSKPKNSYIITQDIEKNTYYFGITPVFENNIRLNSRFAEVAIFGKRDIPIDHFAFFSGVCSDMALINLGRKRVLNFAVGDRIVSFNIGGRNAS